MQVFKVYFKIIRKNLPMLAIYIGVFVGVSAGFLAALGQSGGTAQFTESRSKVAVINYDAGTELAQALVGYIGDKCDVIPVEDDRSQMQDALFFRKVEYIVRIPEGFSRDFMEGGGAALEGTGVPDSGSGVYVGMLIDKYLNCARQYVKYLAPVTQAEVAGFVADDLSKEVPVLVSSQPIVSNGSNLSSQFNFAFYPMTLIQVLGITSFMLVFNDTLLRRRTLCSPVSQTRIGLETLLANFVFTAAVWAFIMVGTLIIRGSALLSVQGLLWAVNLLMIAVVGLSMSFLIGSLIRSKVAQSAVANTVVLSLSALSGSFVPQSLLGEGVLSVAQFLPAYWYVRASDMIGALKSFSWDAMEPILISFFIQLGFAVAFICVTLVITRQGRVHTLRPAAA